MELFSAIMRRIEGYTPKIASDGTSGAYFMQKSLSTNPFCVFKAADEEPGADNNPNGVVGFRYLKKGTTPGDGWLMEVVAYLLDHPIDGHRRKFVKEIGFSGVPPTVTARCSHENFNNPVNANLLDKIGSMQLFMENDGSLDGVPSSSFPDHEVHKIAVLDIRMANADRHRGNILYKNNLLIPIDHGYILPTNFRDCTFAWRNWEQARRPFSKDTADYINLMDAEKDILSLKQWNYNMPSGSAMTLRISTMLLKKGVAKGFTPSAIGNIMCRNVYDYNEKSVIEKIVEEAGPYPPDGVDVTSYMHRVSQIMDHRL